MKKDEKPCTALVALVHGLNPLIEVRHWCSLQRVALVFPAPCATAPC